jgi:hypothetical protein
MKELKEIRISEAHLHLKDNIVRSPILPEKIAELGRNVTILGDSVIEGAVFAYKLEIQQGNAEFKGAVFSQLELFINSEAKGEIIFRKSIGSANSVSSRALKCKLTFCSDINAKKVTLCNAFVGGSIYADEIYLENCVVIGGVFATQTLDLSNSLIGTFNSPSVKAEDQVILMLPSAFSINPVVMAPGTKFFNLTLADLGSLYKGVPQEPGSGKIEMNIESDEVKTTLTKDDVQKTIRSYTVVGKVLAADLMDTDKFNNHFLLTAASLNSQLLKSYDLGVNDKGEPVEVTLEKLRDFFFDILSGKIEVQPIDGTFDISEITSRFK